jgi:hypothetical protein
MNLSTQVIVKRENFTNKSDQYHVGSNENSCALRQPASGGGGNHFAYRFFFLCLAFKRLRRRWDCRPDSIIPKVFGCAMSQAGRGQVSSVSRTVS